MIALVVLHILICPPGGALACDRAEVRARSCAEAEAWARGWLRPGQELELDGCIPEQPRRLVARP